MNGFSRAIAWRILLSACRPGCSTDVMTQRAARITRSRVSSGPTRSAEPAHSSSTNPVCGPESTTRFGRNRRLVTWSLPEAADGECWNDEYQPAETVITQNRYTNKVKGWLRTGYWHPEWGDPPDTPTAMIDAQAALKELTNG